MSVDNTNFSKVVPDGKLYYKKSFFTISRSHKMRTARKKITKSVFGILLLHFSELVRVCYNYSNIRRSHYITHEHTSLQFETLNQSIQIHSKTANTFYHHFVKLNQ